MKNSAMKRLTRIRSRRLPEASPPRSRMAHSSGSDGPEQETSDILMNADQRATQRKLKKQIEEAFLKAPSLSGIIEGRRPIKLGKRWGGRASHFPSKKNATGGMPAVSLPVESRPESIYALELERDPNVKAFRTQAIELTLPGSRSSVFPDFLILDRGGEYHVREVKADKRYLDVQAKQRIERIAHILNIAGITYEVVDTTEMPTGMRSANLFWLHKQFDRIPHQDEIDELLRLDFQRSTYAELRKLCGRTGLTESLVPYLLFIGRLNTDWTQRIDGDSEVWK